MQHSLGVIGLGTMGANLARNAARNGAAVSVYNRTAKVTERFLEEHGAEGEMKGCKSYKDFVQSLEHPRAILLMVKAGEAVDAVLRDLLPLLEEGDIVIDGGNSHYPDTQRRTEALAAQGMHFVGMGISGGEEGALQGPSMMPGGSADAYETLEPLLAKMAADDGAGGKCIARLGEGGAGHFVKMVHNGIEYGVMQLIAEVYAMARDIGGYGTAQLSEMFADWNADESMCSYLLEITAAIFRHKDDRAEGMLIDAVADSAAQKGTGKWTVQAALEYGVAIPTINAAIGARILSGDGELRASRRSLPAALDEQDTVPPPQKMRSILKHALSLASITAYAQGFDLMARASQEEGWHINLGEVARIWRGGCIIRSGILPLFQAKYGADAQAAKAASEHLRARFAGEPQRDWRRAVTYAAGRGIPVPALSASLHAYDAYRSERLPQNLIQAQRDYFGAHTYGRTDAEGAFHTDWAS